MARDPHVIDYRLRVDERDQRLPFISFKLFNTLSVAVNKKTGKFLELHEMLTTLS